MLHANAFRVPGFALFAVFLLSAITAIFADPAADHTYAAVWHQVDSQSHLGLTSSALTAIENLYQSAKKDGATDQVVKALLYRARFESLKEEDAATRTFGRFESEIAEAKGPLAAFLHSIIAELYWKYYQQNRWRISGRTPVADTASSDLATWDLSRIVAAALRHYEASLQDADTLKGVPISDFHELLANAGCCDSRRPTLYDFLAHRAIDFLMSSESDLPKPAYVFQLDSAAYFSEYETFAKLPISTSDSLSFKLHALNIFQDLIVFHEKDGNIEALVDADLKRLEFVRSNSTLEAKDELYHSALENLWNKIQKNSVASEVIYVLAEWDSRSGDRYKPGFDTSGRWRKREAVLLCDTAIARYGESVGAQECRVLKAWLLVSRVKFEVESYEVPGKPLCALVKWNDLNRLAFRIIPLEDSVEFPDNLKYSGVSGDSVFPFLKTHAAVAQWTIALPNSDDHQTHSMEIAMPPLDCGRYVIIGCSDTAFSDPQSSLAAGNIRISRIAYFARTQKNGSYELYVRDRETGDPIQHAVVKKLEQDFSDPENQITFKTKWIDTTDTEGRAEFPADTGRSPPDERSLSLPGNPRILPKMRKNPEMKKNPATLGRRSSGTKFTLEIIAGKDRIFSNKRGWLPYNYAQSSSEIKTIFFTDRSLYRPGQTIYFKGIVLQRAGDSDAIVPNRKNKVTLYDANSQPVSSLDLTTNDYGTISGSFTAPLEGLRGGMHIQSRLSGRADFSVEEYKRPKFEVVMNPVKGQFRLNTSVIITGQAKAYAGSQIDHASIKFRVVRTTRFPWWENWYRPHPALRNPEIVVYDSLRTDDTGGFKITFTAVPDKVIPKSENPTFVYAIDVDITDASGETRSASSYVSIGYTVLDLFVALPQNVNKLKDTAFPVKALNRSGQPVRANGVIRIFRLKGPDNPVRSRYWQRPDTSMMSEAEFHTAFPGLPYGGEDSIAHWPKGKMVMEKRFDTKIDSRLVLHNETDWQQGMYVVESSASDAFGREVITKQYFLLYSPKEQTAAARLGDIFIPVKQSGDPGEKAAFIVGSAYANVNGLFEVLHKGEIINKEWLTFSNSQKLIEIPIEENYRGNFDVHFVFIRNGRGYAHDTIVTVPWSNKDLHLSFESFRDKLRPGQNEEWRIKVAGPKGEKVAAEMVASMYDGSLDAFQRHAWSFQSNSSNPGMPEWNHCAPFGTEKSFLEKSLTPAIPFPARCYPMLNWFGYEGDFCYRIAREVRESPAGIGFGSSSTERAGADGMIGSLAAGGGGRGHYAMANKLGFEPRQLGSQSERMVLALSGAGSGAQDTSTPPNAGLVSVHPRSNLNETAFFYPQLLTNDSGEAVISFTVPEALTRWRILGFAHTKDVKFGFIQKLLVTQKPLMVMPALPRFLREGDRLSIAAKIVNLADSGLTGSAQLMLLDAIAMTPVDSLFGNDAAMRQFTVQKGLSSAVTWEVRVPEGMGPVVVRIVAKAGDVSDGEDNTLPVVANRTLVTETMPLPINDARTKKFTFAKLLSQAQGSSTLRNHRLTLEFAQNPAWYAVQALPTLMENTDECVERIFSRFYATTMASSIANASPKIKAVFDAWKSQGGDALLSNLEKNSELKSAILEETPWVLEGQNETERKHRIGVLFDLNRMSYEESASLDKLQQMQMKETGAWPWFPGMQPDRFITQYIITGLGRLQHLGIKVFDSSAYARGVRQGVQPRMTHAMIEQGLRYLDNRIREDYDTVVSLGTPDSNHLSCEQIQYLYTRSYFTEVKLTDSNQVAFDYCKGQAVRYWLRNNRYLQCMIAVALHRLGETKVPDQIIRSLRENALHSDEMGMYWKEMYEGYYWYNAPIEAQALYIEAFDEVAHDTVAVEEMKQWLLKSKLTTAWPTSKATADACYALLLRGTDLLSTQNTVAVTLGHQHVDPDKLPHDSAESGTGYFKISWNGSEIKPDMGTITVSKASPGAAWGAVYWQYFEDLDKITAAASPLALSRNLFIKRYGDRGPWLAPIPDGKNIQIGDKVTVRIELTVDRNLEYVHMKDQRAAGFEPLSVLSGCKWQDGLGYYESTRDLATNFFFSYLQKGRYVFEYDMVAAHEGDFSNGITSIQCMYAPEFAAHSQGVRVKVGKE